MIFELMDNFAYISVPDIFLDYGKLCHVAQGSNIEIMNEERNIKLVYSGPNPSRVIKTVMAHYHNIEVNYLESMDVYQCAEQPLVSCVILLNSNYEFVDEHTIPSIVFNSRNKDIEIIVVHNGFDNDYMLKHDVKLIQSEKSHIPKAYNKAAGIARGKYLAFFHDDCFISDPDWIDKSINALDQNVVAVGPEYHLFETNYDYKMRKSTDKRYEWSNIVTGGFLKEVPMVMEKTNFEHINGFPDGEIIGQEDIFLHQNILRSGKYNKQIDIIGYHFTGISTISLFVSDSELVKNLCRHFILSKDVVRGMIEYGVNSALDEKIQLCIKMLSNNADCNKYSSWCESLKNIGNADSLDTYMPMLRDQDKAVKKLIDGAFKAFLRTDDAQGMKVITGVVEFSDVLVNYMNYLSRFKQYENHVPVR